MNEQVAATKKNILKIVEREISKYPWTKEPARFSTMMDAAKATLAGGRQCMLTESWRVAWKEVGLKGKPTYKGLHNLPEGE
jgi:hypothetical protein